MGRRSRSRGLVLAPGLYHITRRRHLGSIQAHGIVSPLEAEKRFGAKGAGSHLSNREMVQLISIDGESLSLGENMMEGIEVAFAKLIHRDGGLVGLRLKSGLRMSPDFMGQWHVRRWAHEQTERRRFVPYLEVWHRTTVAPDFIEDVVEIRSLG